METPQKNKSFCSHAPEAIWQYDAFVSYHQTSENIWRAKSIRTQVAAALLDHKMNNDFECDGMHNSGNGSSLFSVTMREQEKRIFLDQADLDKISGLFTYQLKAKCVVVLLTKETLTRPAVLMEIAHASRFHIPIILLEITGAGFDLNEAKNKHLTETALRKIFETRGTEYAHAPSVDEVIGSLGKLFDNITIKVNIEEDSWFDSAAKEIINKMLSVKSIDSKRAHTYLNDLCVLYSGKSKPLESELLQERTRILLGLIHQHLVETPSTKKAIFASFSGVFDSIASNHRGDRLIMIQLLKIVSMIAECRERTPSSLTKSSRSLLSLSPTNQSAQSSDLESFSPEKNLASGMSNLNLYSTTSVESKRTLLQRRSSSANLDDDPFLKELVELYMAHEADVQIGTLVCLLFPKLNLHSKERRTLASNLHACMVITATQSDTAARDAVKEAYSALAQNDQAIQKILKNVKIALGI